jgi:predicted RNA binding protein YcfA (HicA-like mRNA interferase family)
VSLWPSVKARRLYAALLRIGWKLKRTVGSHKTLARAGWPDYLFAFHDSDEVGPRILSKVAKDTGLTPRDL